MDVNQVVQDLLERQKHHPGTYGFPNAARIIKDIPLYIGAADVLKERKFMDEHNIRSVVSIGTGDIAPSNLQKLVIDILDMEHELILVHFEKTIRFIHQCIKNGSGSVLVHCVYGQSRSACVCVAYLMAKKHMTLLDAFNAVQTARPCIYINPGFMKQLGMFQNMDFNPSLQCLSPAHAQFRMMIATKQRQESGFAELMALPQILGKNFVCKKCNRALCSSQSEIPHTMNGVRCNFIYVEPLKWMSSNSSGFFESPSGKLICPRSSCNAKLGSWNWMGLKCGCGCFINPAFQLVPSRIEVRSLK